MKLLWTHHPTVNMVYPCRFFRFSFLVVEASWTCFGQEVGACSKQLEFSVVSLDIGYWLCMAWIVILLLLQPLPCSVLFSVLFPSVPFHHMTLFTKDFYANENLIHSRFWIIQKVMCCGKSMVNTKIVFMKCFMHQTSKHGKNTSGRKGEKCLQVLS